MSGFLLDTNVISELIKPKPEPKVIHWVHATDESLLHLSVLTVGEIRKGIFLLPRGNKRALLESWLGNDLIIRFADRILEISREIAERWGIISAVAATAGRSIPVIDGLAAATALHHNLTLVTRNIKDVQISGLSLFNPWL